MTPPPKSARIVEARLKLRERFLARIQQTPSLSDTAPEGTGPTNRHGMPSLPVGQYLTEKWPVLDMGIKPQVDQSTWQLVIDGAVNHPTTLRFADLLALEQVEDTSDMHCVTAWSKLDMRWQGVRFSTLAALVEPLDSVTHLMTFGYDGYSTNLPLEEALKDDVLLVHTFDAKPLPHDHGGPVRMITPQLYAWKGAKWICRVCFLTQNALGFWEQRGYSNSAHPWRNDRYST